MANDRDEIEGLAAEYVLGTLDAGERRAAEARIAADPAFAADVARWAARLQPLADAEPLATPHADTFGRIMSRIDAEKRRAPVGVNVVELHRSVRRWRIVATVAAAAAAVLAFVVVVDRTQPPQTEFVAMLTPDGGAPAFVLTVDTARNTLSIRRVTGAPAQNKSYELWAIAPGASPKSLGVIEQASYTRDLPYEPENLVFAISLEPKGGSPADAPTGDVVFSGPLIPAE